MGAHRDQDQHNNFQFFDRTLHMLMPVAPLGHQ
jgi:hypothetical protein